LTLGKTAVLASALTIANAFAYTQKVNTLGYANTAVFMDVVQAEAESATP